LSNNAGFVKGVIDAKKTPKIVSMMSDALNEMEKNPKAQIVMFSNFIDHGTNALASVLKESKVPFGTFTGRDAKKKRDQAVADFNAGKIKVLVVSGAGAEGLDLPNATLIQMMDGHYNPEKITQAEARGIRRGGLAYLPPEKREVRVKRYVATPIDDSMSIDNQIYEIAAKKARMVNKFREIVKEWQERGKKAG
jgi:superfamily II DNA/RNA helicase